MTSGQSPSISATNSTTNSATMPTSFDATSATNTPSYEAILKQVTENQKPLTVAQIKATGEAKVSEAEAKRIGTEAKNKTIVLVIVGIISILLAIFGCAIFIINPEISKDVWVIIGPIITAAMSGTLGFLTGEKITSMKDQ